MLSYCSGLSMSPSVACLEAFKGQHSSMISSRINVRENGISNGAGRRCCGGKHAALGWDSCCPDIKMFTPNGSLIQPRRGRCLGITNRTVKAYKRIQTNENAEISQPGRHCIGCIFTNGPTVRFLLFCSAASCIIWSLQHNAVAIAADASLLPNTVRNAKSILHSVWPKTLQVLKVFKDQGLLLAVLLGLSAFFSMAETSITTLWPWKVRELAEKEGEDGVFQLLRRDITRFLTTILIGTTVANIAATALVTEAATSLFGEAGVTAATGVMTVIVLLLTEITPKSIAVHNATEVARFVVRPVAWLAVVLYPVGRLVTVLSMGMLKILGIKSSREPFVTEEELKLMLRGAELSGAIEEEEQDMIENVLEIKDTFVREVMTPLVDVVAIDAEATLMDFRNTWVKHQYSRIPVFERRVDNIVGIAYAMDMLDYIEQAELLQRLTVGRIAHRPAFFVPDSMSVWNLLREFRIRKVHMAIVLNEYGGTIGVVTLEDVVEEIVGEIFDENDSKEEILKKTGYVVQRADGVFDVDANTSIEDLAGTLEVKVPAGPYYYETVSGFVCEAFGYIPRTGERVTVTLRKADIDGSTDRDGDIDQQEDRKEKFQKYRLEILAGNARKISSVRFELVDGLQSKEQTSPRALPRILKRGWEKRHGTIEELNVEKELDPSCTWDANNIEQNINHRDLCKLEDDTVTRNDSVGASEVYDVSIIPANKSMEFQIGKVGIPSDIVHADIEIVDTETVPNTNWEDYEKKVERRREERRKLSAEAAEELDRQRQADIRRREADTERATSSSRRARAEEDADD